MVHVAVAVTVTTSYIISLRYDMGFCVIDIDIPRALHLKENNPRRQ